MIARMDPALLHPIQHGARSKPSGDLLQIKPRDNLVRQRVDIISRCGSPSRAWA